MQTTNEATRNETPLNGIDAIAEYTGKAIATLVDWRHFGFPMGKQHGIMTTSEEAIQDWCKEWHVKEIRKHSTADLEKLWAQRNRFKGSGKLVKGDMTQVCAKLNISAGTFMELKRFEDFPIKNGEGESRRRWFVDSNEWERWLFQHQLLHYAPANPRKWGRSL